MKNTAVNTRKIFFALGTVCTLTVFGGDCLRALDRAKQRVLEIHDRMNAYDPNSEISLVNQKAGVRFVKVSPDTLGLIEASVVYSQITCGSYDITTRPISELWKTAIKTETLPAEQAIADAAALTDRNGILINRAGSSVMLRRRGMQIDLGAIAKGYAADEVRRIFREENVTEAVINLGGTVVNIGQNRRVGIRNPFEKTDTPFSFIDVGDKAIVSSGVYEQGFVKDGVTYHHIIDPLTGHPADTSLAGVTLIGDRASQLDALSTAACVMPLPKTVELLRQLHIEAVFVTAGGDVFTTDGVRCNMTVERSHAA